MHPAFSILFFTTLVGAAQGLAVVVAVAVLSGMRVSPQFVTIALGLAELLLVGGLGSSFLHLGNKMRAWRSVLMWRTSWMSREVIVLPAFIVLLAVWWVVLLRSGAATTGAIVLALPVLVGAFALWYCTAMIYACLRFIEEWAHPSTIVNFTLTGLASGMVLACALGATVGEASIVKVVGPCALIVTLLAWVARWSAIRRNTTLRHKSTLQSATGIVSSKIVQKSMGMSAGSFNTREFFHGASLIAVKRVRLMSMTFAFALPALLMLWGLTAGGALPWILAVVVQAPGVLADRWYFFAQAKHPQNLYYQVVS
jgi:DMSO reductase anchor subunit